MLDKFTAADFVPHINTPFTIRLNDGEATHLMLVEVSESNPLLAAPGTGRMPFGLLFHAPHTRGYLPQQTWRLEHDTMGVLEIFLVPVARDATGMSYEAIFN